MSNEGWRKSSFTGGTGNNCVEVRLAANAVLVRDSKGRPDLTLGFDPASWRAFHGAVLHGLNAAC